MYPANYALEESRKKKPEKKYQAIVKVDFIAPSFHEEYSKSLPYFRQSSARDNYITFYFYFFEENITQ